MTEGCSHLAFGETKVGRKRVMLVPIGVVRRHENGRNYTVLLDRLPLDFNGVVILLDDQRSEPGEAGGQ